MVERQAGDPIPKIAMDKLIASTIKEGVITEHWIIDYPSASSRQTTRTLQNPMSEIATWNESAICPECETSGAMQWHAEEADVRMLCSECPCGWYWQTPDDFHDPMSPTENIVTT